jgi:hypothetical protein
MFLAGAALVLFESYTGHFEISRLERQTDALQKMASLHSDILDTKNEKMIQSFESLHGGLNEYIESKRTPFNMPDWALKLMATAFPWIVAISIILIASDSGHKTIIAGAMMISIPLSIGAAFIPTFHYLISYVLIPVVFCAIPITVITKWGNKTTS